MNQLKRFILDMRDVCSQCIYGTYNFAEFTEIENFKYKFLIMIIFAAEFFSAVIAIASSLNFLPSLGTHSYSVVIFLIVAPLCWLLVRSHPERMVIGFWLFEVICLAYFASALLFVTFDEMRVIWFYLNIPVVFILMGTISGWFVTLATITALFWVNTTQHLFFSDNGMATVTYSLLFVGVISHTLVSRSQNYYQRMNAYGIELEQMNKRLKKLYRTDKLTGLYNRHVLDKEISNVIESFQRYQTPCSLVLIDVDYFKKINDTYGHTIGDAVLIEIANILRQHTRKTDIVGRWGGEEFLIICQNSTVQAATEVAEKLRQAIELHQFKDVNKMVTASFGIASIKLNETSNSLIHSVDQALYHSKESGRNQVCYS